MCLCGGRVVSGLIVACKKFSYVYIHECFEIYVLRFYLKHHRRALWTHGGPTSAFLHIAAALCLLLPRLLLEARLIENGNLQRGKSAFCVPVKGVLLWVVVKRVMIMMAVMAALCKICARFVTLAENI